MRILAILRYKLFKRRMYRAIEKYNGRALCFNCLNPLVWDHYEDREIAITPSQRIMLFCPACHEKALEQSNGEMVATAFYRWYTLVSGLPPERFPECFNNVLLTYGWSHQGNLRDDV